MSKESFNMSREISMLFNVSHDFAQDIKLKEISLNLFVYSALYHYNSGRKDIDYESPEFYELIHQLPEGDILKMMDEVWELVLTERKKSILSNLFDKGEEINLSDSLERVFQRAKKGREMVSSVLRGQIGDELTADDMIPSMLLEKDEESIKILGKYSITSETFQDKKLNGLKKIADNAGIPKGFIDQLLGNNDSPENKDSDKSDDDKRFENAGSEGPIASKRVDPNSKTPTLDQFGVNMTEKAKNGDYDPVVGRDKELQQLTQILCCRKKCNAILLGEPGAGKSAIVEALAQNLANGNTVRELKDRKIYSVSAMGLLSGTQFRGQWEERIQNICKELVENKDIILYIDEFHQAATDNSSSMADFIKPYLGRGEITVIASTTLDEYKKYIEKDGALKRRFQKVLVEEPKPEEVIKILKGLSKKYSEFHRVKYTADVLKACAEWSEKYIYDRRNPDKAIDLMDTAGAQTKLSVARNEDQIKELETKIKTAEEEKVKFTKDLDFVKAREKKNEEEKLREELKNLLSPGKKDTWPEVTIDTVADIVSKSTGIPVDKILNPELSKLRGMKANLGKVIIGQQEAIEDVCKSLSRSYLGLRDETKPIASFLWCGPTGVGKTELARQVAINIFGDEKAMLRIDCGELNEHHAVSKLLGSSSGYVGYNDPPLLDKVRERPSIVLLVDEIDKCAPEIVKSVFLNILSTGFIRLSNNIEVSFRDAVIIFTSNTGTKELVLKGDGIGFGTKDAGTKSKEDKSVIMKAINKSFPPELIGRLTGICVFNSLGDKEMDKIFDIEFTKFKERMKKRGMSVSLTKEAKKYVLDKVDKRYGARNLQTEIDKCIVDKICEELLNIDDLHGKKKISVDLKDDSITVGVE